MNGRNEPNLARLLSRQDKWYVGGGTSVVYAPAFPLFHETPGFWDGVHWADQHVAALFTVLVLDGQWNPIEWRMQRRRWTHEALELTWLARNWLLRERRVIAPPDVCCSGMRLTSTTDGPQTAHILWWSQQPITSGDHGYSLLDAEVREGEAWFAIRLSDGSVMSVRGGFDGPADSFQIQRAETTTTQPLWRVAPFREKVRGNRFANEKNLDVGVREVRPNVGRGSERGVVHIGLHRMVTLERGKPRAFEAWAGLRSGTEAPDLPSFPVSDASHRAWEAFFESVPAFTCDDEFLERYYWYRWWGLRVHMIDPKTGRHKHPSVVEGIEGFRRHISYSAQCHLWETSWLRDPTLARGIMRNMIANQRQDGAFPGSIALSVTGGYYHADWSHLWQVHQLHPDEGFLAEVYEPLSRYLEYMRTERDREGWHLYDVVDQGETGQEYQHRYLAADPHADDWGPIQLKGVGETVYVYQMARCAARIARILRRAREADRWDGEADLIRTAIRDRAWDAVAEWFFDVVPPDGRRSDVFAAVSLYPFMTDIAGPEHLGAIHRHLLNPDEFWTTWPVPAESASDPLFSPEAEWKGERRGCPWNGRNWPMATCHVAEALARASEMDPSLRRDAVTLIRRFVRMMSYDHDPARPNCYEHYNPYTGVGSEYRGIDDYQHSWVVDLIIKYVAGLRPQDDDVLVVDPLPFGLSRFSLERVRYRGHDVAIRWDHGEGFSVVVDGRECARRARLERVELELAEGHGSG